jgi:hypothetical protein
VHAGCKRHFDAPGLRIQAPREWRALHGRTEGYTHRPGVRNVLRIDRYERPEPCWSKSSNDDAAERRTARHAGPL